jgi:septal ring factor EnvC (AmiA/AmiB activator)|tara:strand:- start:2967 stop:3389 length:423 start_codon:yes stop_codon:yes gene_type:complete
MAGNGKSGRKPYKNTAIHKANMKIKKLEKNIEQLATMIGKSDTNIYKLEELVSDLGSMVGQNFDQIDRYGNMQRKLSEDIENLFEMVGSSKKQPRRRRRSYFSLIRSLLYSRKTRRGVRAVAIYGTVIFAGAYALSLLLQ